MMRLFLKHGADVNTNVDVIDASTAFAKALRSKKDRLEKLQLLLAAGAYMNPNSNSGEIAVSGAAGYGDMACLRLLESTGVYLHPGFASQGRIQSLIGAAWKGHVDAVQFLIEKGADIHAEDRHDGLTAVMQAGNQDVLDLLLRAGATISEAGDKKAKALWYAAEYDKTALLGALLDAGVDINAQESRLSKTPLILAAHAKGGKETLPLLIAAGADLELRDDSGWTALISAAERNNTDAVRLLVRAGANLNAACHHALTPLKLAVRNTNREMVRMLVGAGAEMSPEAQNYINAMYHFIAAVLSVLPTDFPWGVRHHILNLVLEQHDGRFLKDCPVSAPWIEYLKMIGRY